MLTSLPIMECPLGQLFVGGITPHNLLGVNPLVTMLFSLLISSLDSIYGYWSSPHIFFCHPFLINVIYVSLVS